MKGSIPTCVGQPAFLIFTFSLSTVYPHVCGAAIQLDTVSARRAGLSPRVWGSHDVAGYAGGGRRSIPTCVGQPLVNRLRPSAIMVYPHVCGAAIWNAFPFAHASGLSPRVWGSHQPALPCPTFFRSIPTCVGQPNREEMPCPFLTVYPHVCGAASTSARRPWAGRGLSPRVWGSQKMKLYHGTTQRSIPTCVGQPDGIAIKKCEVGVYPHVCGAATVSRLAHPLRSGLSPRVWGSLILEQVLFAATGSIPTCVGQPLGWLNTMRMPQVYPHVCGAARCKEKILWKRKGLSPRVWGSQPDYQGHGQRNRSIPTCVGQPPEQRDALCTHPVYPHVCGAASSQPSVSCRLNGLSPRVWGSPSAQYLIGDMVRSIPTCVGQPGYRLFFVVFVEVYPHVCGAALPPGGAPHADQGLSPRVWGSQLAKLSRRTRSRSIPTCVGQPRSSAIGKICEKVYPHVCGAAIFHRAGCVWNRGLSPRVWGSPIIAITTEAVQRSIPTCVGQPYHSQG